MDRADGVALPARGARLNEAGNVDRFRERDVGELHAGIEKAAGIESVLDPDEEVVHLGAVQVAQELRPHAPIAVLSADRAAELRDHDPVDLPVDPNHFLEVGRVGQVQEWVDVGVPVADMAVQGDGDVHFPKVFFEVLNQIGKPLG